MKAELQVMQDEGLEQLTTAMKSDHCLALIGSGPVEKDYGTWPKLLKKLNEGMPNVARPQSCADDNPDADALKDWAETLYQSDGNKFCNLMADHFTREENFPNVYFSVLKAKFRAILTTNFDNQLINSANACNIGSSFRPMVYPTIKPEITGSVVHLHGRVRCAEDVSRIVFTKSQFTKAYSGPQAPLPSILNLLFLYYHICFIGYSFSETEIQEIFKTAKLNFKNNYNNQDACRRTFAFIEESKWESIENAANEEMDVSSRMHTRFTEYGIILIPYSKETDQYAGLRRLIERLPVKHRTSSLAPNPWEPSNEINLGAE